MTSSEFGRLEQVRLRDAWSHEARSFTPWLADNIDRLGEALGIPLELEGQEVQVGGFSADLLARNPQDNSLVLIENQLEQTDHSHLGQILTYMVGLEAECVVWIASDFREPHLAAIHWLNEHTLDPFAFFAVELRAVRIGSSPIAPLFEVMAKPNGWERQVQQQLRSSRELSDLSRWRVRFWECLLQRHPEQEAWGGRDATSSHWRPIPGTDLVVAIYLAQKEVGFFVRGPRGGEPGAVIDQLSPHRDALESAIGTAMGSGGRFGHFFGEQRRGDLRDESCWPEMADWLHRRQNDAVQAIGAVLAADIEAGGNEGMGSHQLPADPADLASARGAASVP